MPWLGQHDPRILWSPSRSPTVQGSTSVFTRRNRGPQRLWRSMDQCLPPQVLRPSGQGFFTRSPESLPHSNTSQLLTQLSRKVAMGTGHLWGPKAHGNARPQPPASHHRGSPPFSATMAPAQSHAPQHNLQKPGKWGCGQLVVFCFADSHIAQVGLKLEFTM